MTDNKPPHEDVSLYEKLVASTERLLNAGRKNIDEVMTRAKDELSAADDFTREQAEKVSAFVERDLQHTIKHMNQAKISLKEAMNPNRIAAGAQSVFARILSSSADTLQEWADKSERSIQFKTGEVTSAGTLTCTSCGEDIHIQNTGRIPPCPKCHHTLFRKSY